MSRVTLRQAWREVARLDAQIDRLLTRVNVHRRRVGLDPLVVQAVPAPSPPAARVGRPGPVPSPDEAAYR
jgi:hypothetical protein